MKVAEKGHLVTLGIMPTYPSTGYGYIKQGERLHKIGGFEVVRVDEFLEKPDENTALQMLRAGSYSWNSGMFVWKVDRIMKEFRTQMFELYGQINEIRKYLGSYDYSENLIDVWAKVKNQSIDYGIMEGAQDIVVIPLEMGWSDIGSWSSLAGLLMSVDEGNVVLGNHISIETKDSLVWGGSRLIATIGLEDMIIVDTNDVLFICPKTKDQKVRQLVKKIIKSYSELI